MAGNLQLGRLRTQQPQRGCTTVPEAHPVLRDGAPGPTQTGAPRGGIMRIREVDAWRRPAGL